MNYYGVLSIFKFEISRTFRTIGQSIISPVLSTILYFVVFGSALGSRVEGIGGVPYGSYILPGLIMLSILGQSVANAAFGIYFPRFTGTIYEILSAPLSSFEIALGYIGAATVKSIAIASAILITSSFFAPVKISHPFWALFFLVTICATFCTFGFVIGLWADGFEQLQMVPLLIMTPLTFLGGTFYSIEHLPEFWRNLSMLNPFVYFIGAFRWSFVGVSDVGPFGGLTAISIFASICLAAVGLIFKTGYRLRN